jgi:hypothetical protein
VERKDEVAAEPGLWAAKNLLQPAAYGGAAKHARRGTSKYALHIGRVGALAVSLGVGLAVAHSSGVAYADSEADSSVAGSKSTGGRPSAGPKVSSETDSEGTTADGNTGGLDDEADTDTDTSTDTDGDDSTLTEDDDPQVDPDADLPSLSEEPGQDAPHNPAKRKASRLPLRPTRRR